MINGTSDSITTKDISREKNLKNGELILLTLPVQAFLSNYLFDKEKNIYVLSGCSELSHDQTKIKVNAHQIIIIFPLVHYTIKNIGDDPLHLLIASASPIKQNHIESCTRTAFSKQPKERYIIRDQSMCAPIITEHGEIIYELTGTATNTPTLGIAAIDIAPKKSSLMHYHPEVEEIYMILTGEAIAILNDQKIKVKTGDIVFIPPNTKHQIFNVSEKSSLQILAICFPAWAPTCSVFITPKIEETESFSMKS